MNHQFNCIFHWHHVRVYLPFAPGLFTIFRHFVKSLVLDIMIRYLINGITYSPFPTTLTSHSANALVIASPVLCINIKRPTVGLSQWSVLSLQMPWVQHRTDVITICAVTVACGIGQIPLGGGWKRWRFVLTYWPQERWQQFKRMLF